eukprot:g34745.t1
MTHKAPLWLASSSDGPPSTVPRVSTDDNEDRETLAGPKSPKAYTVPLQEVGRGRNHEDKKVPGAPHGDQAVGMKPSEGDRVNTSLRCQEATQTFRWEQDKQLPPSGQSRDKVVTAKEQCQSRNPMGIVEMAEGERDGKGRGGADNSPSKSMSSISAAASAMSQEAGKEHGHRAATAFSEEVITHNEDERTQNRATKPAFEVSHKPHPTEQPALLTAFSTATGLRNQDRVDGGNVMAEGQNGYGTNISRISPSRGANSREEQDSNVPIFSYKNPDEGMMIRELGT